MNLEKNIITGNIVPIISYFRQDGSVQEEACRLQVLHALNNGADAVFALGSTGEGWYLKSLNNGNISERVKLLLVSTDAIMEHAAKTDKVAPLMAGVYGETSSEVIDDMKSIQENINRLYSSKGGEYQYLAKLRKKINENNAFPHILKAYVVPPPLNRQLNENEMIGFYKNILENTDLPVYMYNNPKFGDNLISNSVIKELQYFKNLRGIKDSSGTLEQKIQYIKLLDENFSVSCGKEGMIGTFLEQISQEKRKFAGIVPSLGNLTNNPSKIFNLGLSKKDDQMLAEQKNMNSFRNILYDAAQSKGKAQRGVKRCIQYIYRDLFPSISLEINPIYLRDIESNTISKMHDMVDKCIKRGDIVPVL